MTHLDWVIVAGLMVLVFGFAGVRSRKTKTNVDWFLGGRTLPFWMVGVSMFATSVDGGEYVAMNGATYQDGLVMISGLVFGIGAGGVVAAFLVVPSMYRTGLITNAEYLEGRYDPSMRVIGALARLSRFGSLTSFFEGRGTLSSLTSFAVLATTPVPRPTPFTFSRRGSQ